MKENELIKKLLNIADRVLKRRLKQQKPSTEKLKNSQGKPWSRPHSYRNKERNLYESGLKKEDVFAVKSEKPC